MYYYYYDYYYYYFFYYYYYYTFSQVAKLVLQGSFPIPVKLAVFKNYLKTSSFTGRELGDQGKHV